MKILHICLFSSFTENLGYQENMLSEAHAKHGHEVTIISNCSFFKDGVLISTDPVDKKINNNIRLIRIPFRLRFLGVVSRKIGLIRGLSGLLYDIDPDIIIYHGAQGFELFNVANFVKKNLRVKFYVDIHTDYNNSSLNLINVVYHKYIQKYILKTNLIYISKVFYVSLECRNFAVNELGIPESKLEFMPLGGFPVRPEEKIIIRKKIRDMYHISEDTILFIHTGKFNKEKRTDQIVNAFIRANNPTSMLLLAGVFEDDVQSDLIKKINDNDRILYLGWKKLNELKDIIISADCYLQPGSQSASLQLAICCGLAIIIYPHESHKPYLIGNGFFVSDENSIKEKIEFLSNNIIILKDMGKASLKLAKDLLDYNEIASRFYQ